ncbi:MAG: hypothetical protein ACOX6X_03015 [Dethiobacteria bacterium]
MSKTQGVIYNIFEGKCEVKQAVIKLEKLIEGKTKIRRLKNKKRENGWKPGKS